MSRHRNIRNYAYEDDMSEDVYGHSVEDYDMAVSPTTAHQFMYSRGDNHPDLFSNYMGGRFGSVEEEKEEEEEEENSLTSSQDYKRPQLDALSEAKLSSCLDQLNSILGDDCHEPTAVDAILKHDFNVEKALDYIFNRETKQDKSCESNKDFHSKEHLTIEQKAKILRHLAKNRQHHQSNKATQLADATVNKSKYIILGSKIKDGENKPLPNRIDPHQLLCTPLYVLGLVDITPGQPIPSLGTNKFKAGNANELLTTSLSSLGTNTFRAGNAKELLTTPLSSLALPQSGQAPITGSLSLSSLATNTSRTVNVNDLLTTSLSSLALSGTSKGPDNLQRASAGRYASSTDQLLTTSLSSLALADSSLSKPSLAQGISQHNPQATSEDTFSLPLSSLSIRATSQPKKQLSPSFKPVNIVDQCQHTYTQRKIYGSPSKQRHPKRKSFSSAIKSRPTMFALTLCHKSMMSSHGFATKRKRLGCPAPSLVQAYSLIKPFDFSTLSPDDIVKQQQKKRFGNKI
ncbi:predicted protein [Nematostella vectensis]|uniref:HBS1-like protein N-terminal domain-containing protein n=1 Tax=Nematostella vectensis TaxID=45351 RepID=A7RM16_NEMVE|nr:predicted protein [Nematostella vectensis]|eukprot:XP_001639585.1 predicted protein [Nematostella vectensis]